MVILCFTGNRIWVIRVSAQLLLSEYRVPSLNFGYRTNNRKVVNYRQVEKRILDEILGAEVYDTRLRPPGQNKSVTATLVYVNIFVRDFSAISDVTMVALECGFQLF